MKTRILIADDHALLRQGIKRVLNFEDDLEAVKNARMENLKSLAEKGLSSLQSVQGNR